MDSYALTNVCVKENGSMVLQNCQNFIEMTSNMIYIVALDVGLKCPRKIRSNTRGGRVIAPLPPFSDSTAFYALKAKRGLRERELL